MWCIFHAKKCNLQKRILSSGGLFSVESMPGKAAATLRNNFYMEREEKKKKKQLNIYAFFERVYHENW